jgi:hypothetical protein
MYKVQAQMEDWLQARSQEFRREYARALVKRGRLLQEEEAAEDFVEAKAPQWLDLLLRNRLRLDTDDVAGISSELYVPAYDETYSLGTRSRKIMREWGDMLIPEVYVLAQYLRVLRVLPLEDVYADGMLDTTLLHQRKRKYVVGAENLFLDTFDRMAVLLLPYLPAYGRVRIEEHIAQILEWRERET